MEIRNQIIGIFVLCCFMLFAVAYLIKIKYDSWIDECSNKADKEPRVMKYTTSLKFCSFAFKWIKYIIGLLLTLYNNFFVASLGILVLILSRMYDDRQTR